jgi:hypothetical protein
MPKKEQKKETRTATVGVLVSPSLKKKLQEMATEDGRTVSSLTYRLLLESPTLQRELGEVQTA